jgi:hypothetical protein
MNTSRKTTTGESKMKITTAKLIRWSGLSAMAAGTIFAVIQPIHPPDVLASVTTSAFQIITSLKTVMCLLGLFGIAGLYARQVKETGWPGLVGYLLLTIFYAVQMCFAFLEPLVLPLLVTESPKFVESALLIPSGAGGPMNLGALVTVYSLVSALYFVGLLLFGIAIFRARILSRWAALLLALSGPVAIIMSLLPHQIARLAAMPMGIALAWLGYSLWSEQRAQVSQPLPDSDSPRLNQTVAE